MPPDITAINGLEVLASDALFQSLKRLEYLTAKPANPILKNILEKGGLSGNLWRILSLSRGRRNRLLTLRCCGIADCRQEKK